VLPLANSIAPCEFLLLKKCLPEQLSITSASRPKSKKIKENCVTIFGSLTFTYHC